MTKHDEHEKGPTLHHHHPEDEHGEKTHEAIVEQLEGKNREPEMPQAPHNASATDVFGLPHPGKHRLDESREQHDRAELETELKEEEDLDRQGRSKG